MNEESSSKFEQVTAEIMTADMICREELCARLGIGENVLEVCLQWEIIPLPEADKEGTLLFPAESIDRLGRGLRLHRDLGINWPGVNVALALLDRIEELERQIQERSGS